LISGLCYWHIGDHDARPRRLSWCSKANPAQTKPCAAWRPWPSRREIRKSSGFAGRLIEAGERTAELFYNTGLLCPQIGQVDDAIRLYNEASRAPKFPRLALNLGHAYKAKGTKRKHGILAAALEVRPESHGYFGNA